MGDQYFKYNPGTKTCRSPRPTNFEHLLGWVEKIERFLTIHNQEEIVNINQLLESTLNLQISNIIQRVIAQVIGEFGDGFVTIKGTQDGALHVYLAGSDPANPIDVTILAGTELIGKVQIEGTSHEVKRAVINENTIANNEIIALVAGKKICIVNLAFTVDAEADIYLNSDANHMSGPMDFGGTNEPKGFVSNHGNFPLKTLAGEGFFIESDTTAWIQGYVIYYEE